MGAQAFEKIRQYGIKWNAPIVISYDNADCVSPKERPGIGALVFENREDFKGYRLTNRIRLNSELSSFLRTLFSASRGYKREYPNVSVSYGGNMEEAVQLIRYYEKEGYVFIWDRGLGIREEGGGGFPREAADRVEMGTVTGEEFDAVVMLVDDSFYYDEARFLRNRESEGSGDVARVMNLFHGLSRAKKRIALVILDNLRLTEQIYAVLQR